MGAFVPAERLLGSNPLFAPLFGPIPVGGASKNWLESRGSV
jgi:hypothetical protein